MRLRSILFALCLLTPLIGSHAAETATVMVNATGTWYRADRQLTAADLGPTVTATVGSLLDLCVPENPSTGYSWRCQVAGPGLVLVRSAYAAPEAMAPGAGGTRHYLFLVKGAGKSQALLQYGRWWKGGDREPVRKLTVNGVAAAQ